MQLNEKALYQIKEYAKDKPDLKLTVGYFHNDDLQYRVFGVLGKEETQNKFVYEIGSITKTITASLIAKYLDEGKLELGDTIDKFIKGLPSFNQYPSIFQLLTHSSGYGDIPLRYIAKGMLERQEFNFNKVNFLDYFDKEAMKNYIASRNTNRQFPFRYSNVGFGILGYIIGVLNNSTYQQVIEKYIKEELHLQETSVGFPAERKIKDYDVLCGFDGRGENVGNFLWKPDSVVAAAGCMYSTIEDVLAYGMMHASVTKPYFAQMHRPYGKSFEHNRQGLSWIINPGKQYLWHSGGTGGFHVLLSFSKQKKLAVSVLSNYADDKDKSKLQQISETIMAQF